ncbi:sulfatase-like hydrolase/transferase [Paenibacillus sp. MMS18-CY102]|uniref:sulfatase-like hydrolase/transferase n=1 Tax=Paenibacillus sp. MMS18-CY102 TaxID=2682849 RepID=UPI001366492F|nr:sulfatase-like hydrolase/transferase [Paenibacillus sp. MMS18-CY102]MWC28290.1 sulfatase-like hydrolase/transferase [Paenibacillus sp. MMS18-CY102]
MVTIIAMAIFAVWHIWLNMMLNRDVLGSKVLHAEQIVAGLSAAYLVYQTGIVFAPIAVVIIVIMSIAYYASVLHARFFGHTIDFGQAKQLFLVRNAISLNQRIIFSSAYRLMRREDLLLLFFTVAACGFAGELLQRRLDSAMNCWIALDIVLVAMNVMLLANYKSIRNGQVNDTRFGLLFHYVLKSYVRRLRSKRTAELYAETPYEAMMASAVKKTVEDDKWRGIAKGKNVIMIQLESFQHFVLHRKIDGQEITPFLNKLARENMSFTDIFNQYAVGHTADAEFAALHSLYPHKDEIIYFKHYDKKFYGLPHLLREEGYETAAFHGFKGEYYNRRNMMRAHGFEQFHAEEDYYAGDRIMLGLSDRSFFEQTVSKIKQLKEPYFAFLVTLTSHFPFELDAEHCGLNHSAAVSGPLMDYYQSVHYTDGALKHFFELLERENMLDNTIIALYGDHEGVTLENLPALYKLLDMPTQSENKQLNRLEVSKVPFVIVNASEHQHQSLTVGTCGSTVDIAPTIMHLLGMPADNMPAALGESLFTADKERIVPFVLEAPGTYVSNHTVYVASYGAQFDKGWLFHRPTAKRIAIAGAGEDPRAWYQEALAVVQKSEATVKGDKITRRPSASQDEYEAEKWELVLSEAWMKVWDQIEQNAIVLPFSNIEAQHYINAFQYDLEGLEELMSKFRESSGRNVSFYTSVDFHSNNKPIYIANSEYLATLDEEGYKKIAVIDGVTLPAFLDSLPEDVLLVVSAKDDAANRFEGELLDSMQARGFGKLNRTVIRHSYINVLYKNGGFISLYEDVSKERIEQSWFENESLRGIMLPVELKVISSGAECGNVSVIKVGKISCSPNKRGLNIAVVDMATGIVLQTHNVDTYVTNYMQGAIYKLEKEQQGREDVVEV